MVLAPTNRVFVAGGNSRVGLRVEYLNVFQECKFDGENPGIFPLTNMTVGRDSMGGVFIVSGSKQQYEMVMLVGGRERAPGFSNRAEYYDVKRDEWN